MTQTGRGEPVEVTHEPLSTPSGRQDATSPIPLRRLLSPLETWGLGATGFLFWLVTAPGVQAILGPRSYLVWLPAGIVGILINLQVRRLGTLWPELSGGTPNSTSRLLRDHPWLGRYAALSYFLNWAATLPLSVILLTDLIARNNETLGIAIPLGALRVAFALLAFVIAFAGIRTLSVLNLCFLVPSVGLVLALIAWGLGWLTFAPESPGLLPTRWPSLTFTGWARAYFVAAWAAYRMETSSSFVAESRKPSATLKCLSTMAWFILPLFLGGGWLLARLATGPEVLGRESPLLNWLAVTTPLWGRAASTVVTFLLASGCLLCCAGTVAAGPRVLYQLARDGHLPALFASVSRRGVMGPGLCLILLTTLGFLLLSHDADVLVIGSASLLSTVIVMHLGEWLRRGHPESRWPWWSLVFCVLELVVLVVGGVAWGWKRLLIGLLLPFGIMFLGFVVGRLRFGPFRLEWWTRCYRFRRSGAFRYNLPLEVAVLVALVFGSALANAIYINSIDQVWARSGGPAAQLLVILVVILGFLVVAAAAWTSLPQDEALASRSYDLRNQVTERRPAEGALREGEERVLRPLVGSVTDSVIVMLDLDGHVVSWNAGAERIKGYRADEILGQHGSRFYSAEDIRAGKPERELRDARASGRFEDLSWRVRKDGSSFWADVIMAISDGSGRLQGYSRVIRDITERKQAEDALRAVETTLEAQVSTLKRVNDRLCSELVERELVEKELQASEKRFRTLCASSPIGIFQTDAEGRCIYANDRILGIVGLAPGETLGHGWTRALHPDDRDAVFAEWMAASAAHRDFSREYRILTAAGEVRWAHARATVILDADGNLGGHVGTLEDISERKRTEESLRRQSAALQEQADLLDLAHDMIMVRDLDGLIRSWNSGAEASYGWSRAEAVGQRTHDLLRTEFPEPLEVIEAELEREGRWEGELTHTARDGTRIVVASRWVRQQAELYRTVKVLEINSDITEGKRAEVAIRQAREIAEAASRAKSEFLANMSHEIRTPMNGVLGMLELTLHSDIAPRHREFLVLARSSAETLLRLLNDILDFSKIEAGKLELEAIPFSLREALGDTMKTLAMPVHEKGLELTHAVAPDLPDTLVGDPGRLSQLLVNLVGNARRFTERGEIAVRVEREPQAGEGVLLHLSVRDTGIGIAPEKQQHIFAAFSQADGSTTRQYGGTGLGLAICGHLVVAMGGRIWVESRLGHGSTFHFTARFGVHDGVLSPPLLRRHDLKGLPVLVVDDNATHLLILEELLSAWGMRPTVTDGGAAALAAIRQAGDDGEPFPLVLLDAIMPGVDGFAVAEEIQRDPELAGTAVLMLSSADLRDDAERCRALGVSIYLRKPIKESDLLDSILSVLGIEPVTRAGSSWPRPVPLPPPPRPLRVLLAEDTPVNQRLAVTLLKDRGHAVVVANDGRDALEILARESFDLVLMDVQMPRMDGFQATAAIRAEEAGTGRHLPIIAMTAHAMKGDRERCLTAGMDGYISKPIRAEQFLATVEGRTSTAEVLKPGASPAARPDAAEVVFDLDDALSRVRGNRALLRKLAELFLADGPGLLIQIQTALAAGDCPTLERAIHRIKGSAANLSAPRVVAVAGRLEEMARDGVLAGAWSTWTELEAELVRLGLALEILKEEGAACAS